MRKNSSGEHDRSQSGPFHGSGRHAGRRPEFARVTATCICLSNVAPRIVSGVLVTINTQCDGILLP